jgi:hypothetical protein
MPLDAKSWRESDIREPFLDRNLALFDAGFSLSTLSDWDQSPRGVDDISPNVVRKVAICGTRYVEETANELADQTR